PVCAVDGLRFDRGVPPGIEDEHIVGGGQVQSDTARFEADQEHWERRVVLKAGHASLAILGFAVQILERDAFLLQTLAQDAEQRGELREYQRFVTLLQHAAQLLEQQLDLRAAFTRAFSINQAGVASGLPQAQQRLEDLGGAARWITETLLFDARLIKAQQLLVALAFVGFEIDEQGLLAACREIFGDFLLGPAEHEGAQHALDQLQRFRLGLALVERSAEFRELAQH